MKKVYYLMIGFALAANLFSCKEPEPVLPSLFEVLEEKAEYSMFAEMVKIVGMDSVFNGDNYFTIFAPNNQAVSTYLQDNDYESVEAIPRAELDGIVAYHFQFARVKVEELAVGYFFTPCDKGPNKTLLILQIENDGSIILNRKARIVDADLEARNGLVHGIDVLLPLPTMMDFLDINPDLSILVEAIDKAGLRSALSNHGIAWTFFVPSDDAFERYFDQTQGLVSIDDLTEEEAKKLVQAHIIGGNKTGEQLLSQTLPQDYKNLNNNNLNVVSLSNGVLINDKAATISLNLQARNGVIHFISDVIGAE